MKLPQGRPDRFVGYPDEYTMIHPDTHVEIQIADSQEAIDAAKAASGYDPDRLEDPNLDVDGYPVYANHRIAEAGVEPCKTCAYYKDDTCQMFSLPTAATDTCSEWSKTR